MSRMGGNMWDLIHPRPQHRSVKKPELRFVTSSFLLLVAMASNLLAMAST